ncbi:MAG TPA: hypothetical protein VM659_03300 [Dongiaceae bacterium]|nr:hypothetical protein [Dongiaceae bacterium]
MDGWVSVSLEREPSYFAKLTGGEEHQAIIARDTASGEAVGMCGRTVRPAYIDGQVRPLGYIGELRIAAGYRHRYQIIRQGFDILRRDLHRPDQTPFYLTAVIEDNTAARRLLEANLPGKPSYRSISGCTTSVIRTRRGTVDAAMRAKPDDIPAIAQCLARNHARYQFAPVWQEDDIRNSAITGGPGISDFLVHRVGSKITGCIALWDQAPVRQAVIRGYRAPISWLRPAINLGGPLMGLPRLPHVGEALRQVYLSFTAVDDDNPEVFRVLVCAALRAARQRDFDLATISLAAKNDLLPILGGSFPGRDYHSQLYLVHWPDGQDAVAALGEKVIYVEAGLL